MPVQSEKCHLTALEDTRRADRVYLGMINFYTGCNKRGLRINAAGFQMIKHEQGESFFTMHAV
jgi:hypothetical protein